MPGNLTNGNALLKVGEHCIETYVPFFCLHNLNTERSVDWINLAKEGDQGLAFLNTVVNPRITDMV